MVILSESDIQLNVQIKSALSCAPWVIPLCYYHSLLFFGFFLVGRSFDRGSAG